MCDISVKIQSTGIGSANNQQLLHIFQAPNRQARSAGVSTTLSESADASLPDGHRVKVDSPAARDRPGPLTHHPQVHRRNKLTFEQLVRFGAISPEGADVLQALGRAARIKHHSLSGAGTRASGRDHLG